MSRISERLAAVKRAEKKAFVAFVTAGDPSLDRTVEVALAFDDAGVDAARGRAGGGAADPRALRPAPAPLQLRKPAAALRARRAVARRLGRWRGRRAGHGPAARGGGRVDRARAAHGPRYGLPGRA